ncbi:universal stress protein [Pedobacter cryophilus]|uniref:Universal stress protein n=1 Tax=Pedobacter cryophilus TaxID=2571271 RepID=A0A4U1C0P6_9SPHI|nr:universal stress protein [Pedobacter cryophilus]TKB97640.1 universal stress protein [Pedobacter cryophilus]
MKNIFVFTDFSFRSFNAARYALMLASTFESAKIVLYHSYVFSPTDEGYLPYPVDLETLRAESLAKLNDLETSLTPFITSGITMMSVTDGNPLLDAVDLCKEEEIDLCVMGCKGHSNAAQILYGSQTSVLIYRFPLPLLVVPAEVVYHPIQLVAYACELKNIEQIPADTIISFIKAFHSKFYVLNVDPHKEERADIETILAQEKLHQLLDEINPEYYYTSGSHIAENIENFAKEKNVDVLIAVHKKHGLFHDLFYSSTTKKLALSGVKPLLVLKENSFT